MLKRLRVKEVWRFVVRRFGGHEAKSSDVASAGSFLCSLFSYTMSNIDPDRKCEKQCKNEGIVTIVFD